MVVTVSESAGSETSTMQTDCEHSSKQLMVDTYLGTTDDGQEKWGRKCLACGDKTEFTYDA